MRPRALNASALETLLAAAVAAPSFHNTQPWRFRLEPGSRALEVHAVPDRTLRLADPYGRAQHLSVGAAVFNVRLAAAHLGWCPRVRLLPDPARPELLATVRMTLPTSGSPREPKLYESVPRRHSSRMPFTGRPVPEPVVNRMAAAARAELARLYVPEFTGTRRLLRLTALAETRNRTSPARSAETRSWLDLPGSGGSYGIPLTAIGPSDAAGRMPMRDFTGSSAGARHARRAPALRFERHAQVGLLWTSYDRPEDWLRAGQALQRVLLTATEHGVRTSILHQAMEWPDLRLATRPPRRRCHSQLLIRFGYGPEGSPTPRARAVLAEAAAGSEV